MFTISTYELICKFFYWYALSSSCFLLNILKGSSKDRDCNSSLLEEQVESAEGVEEPQAAPPHPPVVIDHQRLSVKGFISTLLFSVGPYLCSKCACSGFHIIWIHINMPHLHNMLQVCVGHLVQMTALMVIPKWPPAHLKDNCALSVFWTSRSS